MCVLCGWSVCKVQDGVDYPSSKGIINDGKKEITSSDGECCAKCASNPGKIYTCKTPRYCSYTCIVHFVAPYSKIALAFLINHLPPCYPFACLNSSDYGGECCEARLVL